MKRLKQNLTTFLIITIISLNGIFLSSCSTKRVVIQDRRIRAHWISQGEKAPFDGILLNKYTFEKLKEKAKSCSKDNSTK